LVNRYERDPRARQECIRYYGTKCFLCGFDFAAQYGGVMAGFIHVHHLASLASVGEDYEVDPVEDLRPVCPNCHAVLHRKEPPYSLEDVRRFLEQ
jgi:5-methylcytosine-specific restriction protein A